MKFFDKIIYRIHAVRRMFERDISEASIEFILQSGTIVQQYLDDKPYPSYLIFGEYENRPLHIVAAVDEGTRITIVITVYEPDLDEWDLGYTVRRKK